MEQARLHVICGGAGHGSMNLRLAATASAIARSAGAELVTLDLRELALPLCDGDIEAASGVPTGATRLRNAVVGCDAMLIASPEYDRFPAPLLRAMNPLHQFPQMNFAMIVVPQQFGLGPSRHGGCRSAHPVDTGPSKSARPGFSQLHGVTAMPTPQEIESKFWKALKSDMTVMLGVHGVDDGHARPMTAQLDGDEGPLWFFTSTDSALVSNVGQGNSRALCTFTSKGNDVYASVHGTLQVDNNRATIEKLWNPHIAAWYEGGKDDPKLVLLRLDADRGEIWLEGSSIVAGIKMLFGADPKKDYQDNIAKVDLS